MERTKCITHEEEHVQHIYRRRGQQPLAPFLLIMVVVTPSFMERYPPSSNE
jgi:hypothetical protein